MSYLRANNSAIKKAKTTKFEKKEHGVSKDIFIENGGRGIHYVIYPGKLARIAEEGEWTKAKFDKTFKEFVDVFLSRSDSKSLSDLTKTLPPVTSMYAKSSSFTTGVNSSSDMSTPLEKFHVKPMEPWSPTKNISTESTLEFLEKQTAQAVMKIFAKDHTTCVTSAHKPGTLSTTSMTVTTSSKPASIFSKGKTKIAALLDLKEPSVKQKKKIKPTDVSTTPLLAPTASMSLSMPKETMTPTKKLVLISDDSSSEDDVIQRKPRKAVKRERNGTTSAPKAKRRLHYESDIDFEMVKAQTVADIDALIDADDACNNEDQDVVDGTTSLIDETPWSSLRVSQKV